ncbi:MAG: hypothetical protein LUO88_00360 [Methanoregulaceae archaeon]|nr:hypothetical protein [Methanoregulaceae archaeon]
MDINRWSAALVILLCLMPIIIAARAETEEKTYIYQTDFSTNPGWTTNNPTRYYWDSGKQMYHYYVEGGTGGYAFVPVNYDNGPFTLEYDVLPIRTDKDAAFRFGIGSTEMDISQGTILISEFTNRQYGRLMDLRVITGNNNLLEVSSLAMSYCANRPNCETKHFEDNKTYHVTLRFNTEATTADMKVTEGPSANGNYVWGYYVTVARDLPGMSRLFISSIGDYGGFGLSAEGYIDNVELYHPEVSTPAPTTRKTPPPTEVTSAPVSTPPATTPVPTKSGDLLTVFFGATGAVGIAALLVRRTN